MAAPRLDPESDRPAEQRPTAFGLSIVIALCTGLLLALLAVETATWQRDARTGVVQIEARALADAVARVDTSAESGAAAVQKAVQGLPAALPGVKEALVLEGTQLVAHTDASLSGSRLKRDDLGHKALYDDSRALQENLARNAEERQKYADLSRNPYPMSIIRPEEGVLYVAVPVVANGEMRAMVALRADPPAFPAGGVAFQLSLAAAGLVALAMVLNRLAPGDARVPVGLLFLAVSGFLVWNTVQSGSSALRAQLDDAAARSHGVWKEIVAAAVPPPVAPEEGAAPAPNTAAQPADTAPAPDTAAQPVDAAPAPVPPPSDAELVRAINVDAYGNPIGTYREGAAGGQGWVQPGVQVDAYWTWRGVAVVFAVFILYLVLLAAGLTRRMASSFRENWYAYAYVAPAVVGTALLVFGPFLFGIVLGFYTRVYSTYEFVGLQNFVQILSDFDFSAGRNFYRTLGVTVIWTVINVSLHVSIGLALALILKDRSLRFTPIYRTLLVVPWALPNYITALIWKGMFNKEYGAINTFLALVGIEPVSWFNSFWGAFTANVVTNVWLGFPFMMVISLGALQSIPAELYEAAEVDGAGKWDQFRRITLPLLKPALFPAVILGTIWTFNQFNVIYLVSGGAPDGATDILITEAYRWAFEGRQQYGYAAAYSTIIFLILFGYTYVTNRITKSTEGAYA